MAIQHSDSPTAPSRLPARRFLALCALAVAAVAGPAHAADPWPSRPIQLIVPFAPGGTTDVLARLVAEGLTKRLNQSVIVENKPGAGANIGAAMVAHAAPDGYTLLLATPGPLAINANIYKRLNFDPEKDFAPVAYVADVPNVILAYPGTGLKNMRDLIDYAKAHPGKLNWASPGVGSTAHIELEVLKQMTGVDIVHVPFKGASQVSADLIAGHVELAGDNLPTALGYIKSGKEVALGVTSEKAQDVLPGVQPVGATVPGYAVLSWFAVVAPAGTPTAVVQKLNTEVNAIIGEPAMRDKFQSLGAIPVGGPPDKLARQIGAEQERYRKLLPNSKEQD
ncbi:MULTISPECIES: tripartite tricarboxylate transporter substrate binding protein [unclassified Achromobacter]|uniref:tripartite tricarboxylate transporter substrate binding protein n=1 Tax=unclassified Achromobacter TaxID=2626865 RepID=UPI000B51C26F|nr:MULTISPECIES: tripartite tricarboxylate transporter substrate binding protein [unclassified Achromobacter]OWT73788.1 ABC transporter substrate-binding protein [Achromobacter sp. HZ34]OWT79297.1 ABC transporter substrate-binding protein [Achromobacter sp. HZ28]